MASSAALDALRVRIRALEGGTSVRRRRVASGVGPLDVLIGGLPEPGIVELAGPDGSGRVRLALGIAAAWTRAGRSVAWVDPARRLYPPACADLGVGLERLLIVRPTEDGSAPWAWATEQLLRSGCFPLVVIDHPDGGGHRRALAHGWARAAEHGRSTAIVISRRSVREVPADVRLAVGGGRVLVMRDRAGSAHGGVELPPWPLRACPWG